MGLSLIAVEQTKATKQTMGWCADLLNYLSTNQDEKVQYRASDMVMNIHSDASYLSETKARSRACGIFFMGWMSKNGEPNELNGALYVNTTILLLSLHQQQDGITFWQRLPTWDTHNHEPPSIVIMPRQPVSPITPWNTNVCDLWKWDFLGREQRRIFMKYAGTRVQRI